MRTIRQVNIKNRQNYFFNDMTNISDFDPSFLNSSRHATPLGRPLKVPYRSKHPGPPGGLQGTLRGPTQKLMI